MKSVCFVFNDTATTEIYTLSLHDALPIWSNATRPLAGKVGHSPQGNTQAPNPSSTRGPERSSNPTDRKSTRLNSSHANISYAVFCLKKKIKMTDLHSTHSLRYRYSL